MYGSELRCRKRIVLSVLITALFSASVAPCAWPETTAPPAVYTISKIYLVNLEGSINPGTTELIRRAVRKTHASTDACLIIQLDTPGGLVASLRDIVQEIMASSSPIVVYVAPSGAQAASAGALLTLAADIAAMAPGTNIGAAHPVSPGSGRDEDETMAEKTENDLAAMARSIASEQGRNATWAERAVGESISSSAIEAEELGVIDMIARDLDDLLRQMEGRTVRLPEREVVLDIRARNIVPIRENLRERILRTIADPDIAYLLMMLGMLGLYFEFANPGAIFSGAIGALCLLLGLFSLQTLPVSAAGILLLILAAVLFIMEILIVSYGILGAAGLVALVMGSLMFFDTPATGISVTAGILWPTILVVGSFFALIAYLATRATLSRPRSGRGGLIGETGTVRKTVSPEGGLVFLHGELWHAASDDKIPVGSEVEVTDIKGLKLRVTKVEGGKK